LNQRRTVRLLAVFSPNFCYRLLVRQKSKLWALCLLVEHTSCQLYVTRIYMKNFYDLCVIRKTYATYAYLQEKPIRPVRINWNVFVD
jgi:hypothetical protein